MVGGMIRLPVARDGRPVLPGDRFRMLHNGNVVKVRSIEYMGELDGEECWRVWPEGSGGGWFLPKSRNVMERL